jgi:hypothetical protein
MAAWRILGTLVVTLGVAAAARAQTFSLKEAPLAQSYFRVKMHMGLSGVLKIRQEDKVNPLKQQATADHDFLERVLEADAGGPARKVARAYKDARAEITTAGRTSKRSLREERALVVAQCYKGQSLAYSPKGPLTRPELDVLQHFDTLHLPGLLPGKEVAVGDTWKVSNDTAQALCSFEALTSQELTGKLDAVKDGFATVSVTGTASGIDLGASVKLKITAACRFDLTKHRLRFVEWKQHDERDQGPASPALESDLTITVERTPVGPAGELNDLILALVPTEQAPPEGMTALWHRDAANRYELTCARDWQTVARTEDQLVLRLLERGDFVAQATVTWWTKAPAGEKHMAADDFKEAMASATGWEQETLVDAKEVEAPRGCWLYRVEAAGKLNGLSTLQYFYLLAGPQGQQVVVAFALTPNQAQKLGTRDLALVRGLAFPEGPPAQAAAKAP